MTQSVPPLRWQQRFMEPTVAWAMLAAQNRTRGLVCSDRDGVFQLYAWDRSDDSLTRITDSPQGVQTGAISADGEHIYYLHCAPNSQTGHIRRVPFTGGQAQDLTPDMPTYSSWYITESESGSHVGFVAAALVWGFRVYVLDASSGEVVFTYESDTFAVGPNLSYDGELAVIATDDRGDGQFALECYDVASGKRIADLSSDTDSGWQPVGFVPRRNDRRYLTTDTGDIAIKLPALWHTDTGEITMALADTIRQDVTLWDITRDGRYLLLSVLNRARHNLYRYDLEQGGEREHLGMMAGRLYSAYWASDTQVHALIDDPARPPHIAVIESDGTLSGRLLTDDITPEENAAWQSVHLRDLENWLPLQAWLLTPAGDPPYPTIIHAHGGPADVFTPTFDPRLLAWRDAGYAVCAVNYRGSISFGSWFQGTGQIDQMQSDDLAAAARHLVAEGIARPDCLIVEGASYGGYLTLMALSRQPDLWRAGLATAAIADWEILFRDEALAPPLRPTVKGLFGGTPDSRANAYRAASPLHLPLPQAPLLILQPRQDATCPPQQMIAYAGRLAETQNAAVQVRWYNPPAPDAIAQQQIEQHQQQRAFLQGVLSSG